MWDSKRDTDVKNSLLDSVGEGEGTMIWENSTETCILSYVKQIASPSLMHETGCSGLVHWDNPEGWDGEWGGRGSQDGEPYKPMADSCQYMAKTMTGGSSVAEIRLVITVTPALGSAPSWENKWGAIPQFLHFWPQCWDTLTPALCQALL